MQSFLKNAFVPSTGLARLVSNLIAIALLVFVGWTATNMIASIPHDATPTVGDLHVIFIGYALLIGSLVLMAGNIGRVVGSLLGK